MDRNIMTFLDACMKVRNERAANELLGEWADLFKGEAWWQANGAPGARIALMVQHHLAGYLKERASKPKVTKVPAAGEEKPSKVKRIRVYLGREEDGDKPSASFDKVNDAERWAYRKVAEVCGDTFAVIVDMSLPEKPTRVRVSKDRAVKMMFGRREAGASMHQSKSGGSGPWMKASQTRSSFSRG